MRFSGRRIVVLVLLVSTLFVGSAAAASSAGAATTFRPTASEVRMGWLINRAREHANRWGLKYSPALSKIARAHSALMASEGTIFHTTNLANSFRNFSWTIGGENVGMGPSMYALHTAFMLSPHHRENNLDKRFHRFGIGVVWKNGIAFVTVQFLS
ncbi:MAG TPA: CAP domain-containing protein [Actinomycetota bacterium]|nr:CAP domain-containing protein [Actinomycetota bacterium]